MNVCFLKRFPDESQNERIQNLILSVEKEFPRHWKKLIPDISFYLTSDPLTECPEFVEKLSKGVLVNLSSTVDPRKLIIKGMVTSFSPGKYEIYTGYGLAELSDDDIKLNTCHKIAEMLFVVYGNIRTQFDRIFEASEPEDLELFGTVVAEAFIIKPPFSSCGEEIRGIVKKKFSRLDQWIRNVSSAHTN